MITAKNEHEVETFLREFKPKFSIWDCISFHEAEHHLNYPFKKK